MWNGRWQKMVSAAMWPKWAQNENGKPIHPSEYNQLPVVFSSHGPLRVHLSCLHNNANVFLVLPISISSCILRTQIKWFSLPIAFRPIGRLHLLCGISTPIALVVVCLALLCGFFFFFLVCAPRLVQYIWTLSFGFIPVPLKWMALRMLLSLSHYNIADCLHFIFPPAIRTNQLHKCLAITFSEPSVYAMPFVGHLFTSICRSETKKCIFISFDRRCFASETKNMKMTMP